MTITEKDVLALKAQGEKRSRSKKAATKRLIAAGILTKKGNLKKVYKPLLIKK